MDANIWFYTLSTVSQTFAAILALGGTFVIFKLERLNDRIKLLRKIIIDILYILLETKMTAYYNISDVEFVNLFENELGKIDLKQATWGLFPTKKADLRNLYINNEISSRVGPSRTPNDEEVFQYFKNIAGRFAYDICKVKKVLVYLKISLIILSAIIFLSIYFIPLQALLGPYDFLFLLFLTSLATFALYLQAKTIWVAAYE